MMLPHNYGQYQMAVRKGALNGTILDSIVKAQNAIDNYEKQSQELARTQAKLQNLITVGQVVLGLSGIYLVYSFLNKVNKK